ncbi:hypothetical protein GGR51DRAFT_459326 [Nemania sp. FL0031]|nr:hypothetical protein GGR51DRAFT_459326 [Nemania sp. FL0031]
MGFLDNPDQRAAFFISVLVTPVCILLTVLRFTSARRVGRKVGLEDWFALVALFFYLVWVVFALVSVILENGRNVLKNGALPKATALGLIKSGYIVNSVYPINQTFAKLSLLILYYRIFSVSRGFAQLAWIVAISQILWFIPNFVERLLVCNPPAKLWNPDIPGFCVNGQAFVAVAESINSFIDFVMIGMAIWMVTKLRMSMKSKVKLSLVFAAGGLSGIIGIIKIIQVYGKVAKDGTDLPWILIQMASTVICCSVPLHRSILTDFHILSSLRSTFFTSSGSDSQKSAEHIAISSIQTIGKKSSNSNSNRREEWLSLSNSSSTRELATHITADPEAAMSRNDISARRTLEIEQTVHHNSG